MTTQLETAGALVMTTLTEVQRLREEAKRIARRYATYYAEYRAEPGFDNRMENLTRLSEMEDAIDELASLALERVEVGEKLGQAVAAQGEKE